MVKYAMKKVLKACIQRNISDSLAKNSLFKIPLGFADVKLAL